MTESGKTTTTDGGGAPVASDEHSVSPLLKARPAIAEELSETLASLQLANRTALDHRTDGEQGESELVDRVAATIRRLFSLH